MPYVMAPRVVMAMILPTSSASWPQVVVIAAIGMWLAGVAALLWGSGVVALTAVLRQRKIIVK